MPAPLWAQEALAGDVTAEASDESVPSAEVAPDVVVERVSSDATEPATAVEESKTIELSRVEMHRAGKKISADVDALLTPGDAIQAGCHHGRQLCRQRIEWNACYRGRELYVVPA